MVLTVHLAMFPASRSSPTFTGVLSMLHNGFLEFLSIVYNSFQRYTFVIFIRCDVNWRIMLKVNRCTKNLYYSYPSYRLWKIITFKFFSLSVRWFFIWYSWEIDLFSQQKSQKKPFPNIYFPNALLLTLLSLKWLLSS